MAKRTVRIHNSRGLSVGTSHEVAFVRKYIKAKHMRYLKVWQNKLSLSSCAFVLRAKEATEKVPLASLQCLSKRDKVYLIWLTPRTLRSKKDWRDSIIHELLHALFWELGRNRRCFPMHTEEWLVSKMARVLSRNE